MPFHLSSDSIPVRKPHFQARVGGLHFLLSRRPVAPLDSHEQTLWDAIDGQTCIADLRKGFATLDSVLQRFVNLGVCDLLPAHFPHNRRPILVIEPHMDDAALSVGGAMWLRRNECEFTVLTLAGISDFAGHHLPSREALDFQDVTALRRAESSLFARHLGGHHVALDLLEAPLRYRHSRATLDGLRQQSPGLSTFPFRSPPTCPLEEWTAALAGALGMLDPEEIWIPLGVGPQVDHQLARDACLRIFIAKLHLIQGRKIRLYEDVPYTAAWPRHASDIISALRDAGARIEVDRVDISAILNIKLQLCSIFSSQFTKETLKGAVTACASQAGSQSSQLGEALHELIAPPDAKLEGFASHVERHRARGVAGEIAPWLRRHQSASRIRIFLHTPASTWAEWRVASDVQLLLDFFTRARFEVYLDRSWLPEIEALCSPRILIRPVENGRWSRHAAVTRLLLSRPAPLLVVGNPGKEHHARWLRALCPGSDPIVVRGVNALIAGLRFASAAEPGKAPLPGEHTQCYFEREIGAR